jgi:bacteriocin biosynthesis cyclodehydratase domain-containing protein
MSLSFAPHLDVLAVRGRGLVTIGEHGCDVYSGEAFAKLADLVDGERGEAAILAAVEQPEREAAAGAIAQLRRAGALIETANGSLSRPEAAWWSSQLVSPQAAAARIAGAQVRVIALGDLDPTPTIEALTAGGASVCEGAAHTIVLVADYLDERLADVNSRALREGRPWLLSEPASARVLVGPAFSPDQGPCWECLAERLDHNRALERQIRWMAGAGEPPRHRIDPPASQLRLGPALVATETLRWLAGARPGFEAQILSFDARSWESAIHRIPWRPQCPACGAGEAPLDRGASPIRLRGSRGDGSGPIGLRSVAPQITLGRLEHHVSPLTGAVHTLRRTGGPEHLHAYLSGGPVARIHGDRSGWDGLRDTHSGGKGTSDQAARASALCEALERYSGGFFGDEPRRTALLEELGEPAIHPNDYMRFSDAQFAERERLNQRSASFRTYVPVPFDARVPIDWSPVWSLSRERERWFPTALAYYGAQLPGAQFCVAESNGNAAGNTLEEAILHGVLELVERDHVALWWYNRTSAPGVDLDTIDDLWLAALREHIASEGRELWALDLSADLGIPVAAALVAAADGSGVGMGFGAHLDLRGAVIRAATELAQLGLGAPSGGLGHGVDPGLRLSDHAFAAPARRSALRSCAHEPPFEGDVLAALERCRSAIERAGMELLVLDQTRPDIGLPVVKAIVPGLRHFWPRFAPGRLYDVPVALGRLERPRAEHELNPTPPVP